MSEEATGTEIGVNTATLPKPSQQVRNPFPDDRRESLSPEEKFKQWVREQGERDKQAARFMKDSKKQRKIKIA